MPRRGRAFEMLVARLEAVAALGDARISSPEFIRGKRSRTMREVDVTVRSKVGSSHVLVVYECRERDGTEDVTWVDAIAGKKDDVGADVAVLVASTGGFSKGARTMAESLGVQLRTVDEITFEDVAGWNGMSHFGVNMLRTRNPDLLLSYFANTPRLANATEPDDDGNLQIPLDAPMFAAWNANDEPPPEDPELLTGAQVHSSGVNFMWEQMREHPDAPDMSDWVPIEWEASTQQLPSLAVMTEDGLYPVAGAVVRAEFRIEKTEFPFTLHSVSEADGSTTQVMEAVAVIDGQERTVSFVRTADGEMTVLLQANENEDMKVVVNGEVQ